MYNVEQARRKTEFAITDWLQQIAKKNSGEK